MPFQACGFLSRGYRRPCVRGGGISHQQSFALSLVVFDYPAVILGLAKHPFLDFLAFGLYLRSDDIFVAISLKISDIVAVHQSGATFYDIVKDGVSKNKKVVVDMESVTSLPSVFLNVSIGRIIYEFGTEAMRHFTFVKITKVQAERLQKYLSSYSS